MRAIRFALIGLGLTAAMTAAAQNVSVQLGDAGHQSVQKMGQGKLVFHLENRGADSVHVLSWATPLDETAGNIFHVEKDGVPVRYIGNYYKRSAPEAEDYFELKPGEERQVEVDLRKSYDLSEGGAYTVTFAPRGGEVLLEARQVEDSGAKIVRAIEHEATTIWVNPNDEAQLAAMLHPGYGPRSEIQSASVLAVTGSNSYVKCTASQQSEMPAARDAAVAYAQDAQAYLAANKTADRFTWWFGPVTTSHYSLMTTHFNNLVSALSTQPYTFDCGCKQKRTYAYVNPSNPYYVTVCGAFWSAPNTGTDSRGGTLIHESSHFTVIAGTDDYAYGQTAAHNLSLTNSDQAVMNADSHEYFGENTPTRN